MSIRRSSLPLAALLCAGLAVSSACVRGSNPAAAPPSIQWELSSDARLTYAALLLNQSLRGNSVAGVLEAADIFIELAPLAQPLSEAAAWLLVNKQPLEARHLLERALVRTPDELSLHLLMAESWLEENNTAKAVEVLEAFGRKHPGSDLLRQELGILLLKAQRYAESAQVFAALPPTARVPYIRYCHARALTMLNRSADAAKELELAVKEQPQFLEAWSELARSYELNGKPDKARTVYRRLMAAEPDNPDFRLRAMGLELISNRPAKALELTRNAPEGQGFLLTAASMFMEARRYTEAETVLDNLGLAAENAASVPDEVWLLRAGIAFEGHNDPRQALEWLDRITPGSRLLDRAYRYRIQILFAEGNDPAIQDALRSARSIFPDEREFMLMEAHFHLTRQNLEHTRKLLADVLARFPEELDVLFTYGSVLDELGQKPEALGVMEKILALDPNHYQALNYVGYMLACESGINPATPQAQVDRDLTRALEVLRRAAALAPNKAYVLDSLAWALFRSGNQREALQTIRKAVSLPDSDEWEIWNHYGDIAQSQNLNDEARRAWRKALSLVRNQYEKPDKLEKAALLEQKLKNK